MRDRPRIDSDQSGGRPAWEAWTEPLPEFMACFHIIDPISGKVSAMTMMRRMFGRIVLALILPLQSLAQAAAVPPQPMDIPGSTSYVYKTIDSGDLRLHYFSPPGRYIASLRPAIVFFSGGNWTTGWITQFQAQAKHFAERGMVAILADYRVFGRQGTGAFEAMTDAASAIRRVRARAVELGIDPNRIAASGAAAGGHLALSAAVFDTFNEKGENLRVSAKPNALVLFNPVVDTTYSTPAEFPDRFGVRAKEGSPAHHVGRGLPPMIVMHGTADRTVPFADVERYCAEVRRLGNDCQLVKY